MQISMYEVFKIKKIIYETSGIALHEYATKKMNNKFHLFLIWFILQRMTLVMMY